LVLLGFLTTPLSAASGLYYLSELVEEHTVITKRFLTRLIYSIMGIQLLLCLVDRFPFFLTLLGIGSHFVYLGNMRRFPYVKLSDPLFITSCGEQYPAQSFCADVKV
jgi:formate hydrogenlyase subunit 4